jgi:hypothetical protein
MDKRIIALYLVAAVFVYFGVDMMVSPADDDEQQKGGAGAAGVVEVDPELVFGDEGTGYMGTGRPQINFVEGPEWPADQKPPRRASTMDADREYNGNARSDELNRVLENLGGMDVYVEGVDGPAPETRGPTKR